MQRTVLASTFAVAAILCAPAFGLSPGQALGLVGMAGGFLLVGVIVMAETKRAEEEAHGDVVNVPRQARGG